MKRPAIWIASITAAVTLIMAYWQFVDKPAHVQETTMNYTGRVTDAATKGPIHNAKVAIEEGQNVPQIQYTDSEGIFHLVLRGSTGGARIRVEATGYVPFDRNVSFSRSGIEPISLTATPTPPVQIISPPPGAQSPFPNSTAGANHNPRDTARKAEGNHSVSGIVIDADTGKPVAGVRVYVDGYSGEAMITKADGMFNLATHFQSGRMFWIRAEKEGYGTKEVVHQAGSQTATIRLLNNK